MESGKRAIRIVIVDDHPMFRDGLGRLLNAEDGFKVIGEVGVGDAVKQVRQLLPDILLLSHVIEQAEVKALLDASATEARLVLLCDESNDLSELRRSGARGIVLKSSSTLALVRCIRAVMNGEYWIDQRLAPRRPPRDTSGTSLVGSPKKPRGPRNLPPRKKWWGS